MEPEGYLRIAEANRIGHLLVLLHCIAQGAIALIASGASSKYLYQLYHDVLCVQDGNFTCDRAHTPSVSELSWLSI